MNSPCEEMRYKIADYILGILSQDEIEALDKHISQCSQCKEYADALQNEKQKLLQFGENLDKEMNSREIKVIETLDRISNVKTKLPSIWRIIMKSHIAKLAAAATIIAVVLLGIHFLDKSATPAYALEQTIEANQDIRFLHFRFDCSNVDMNKEAWIQYDQNDNIKNIRVNFGFRDGENKDLVEVWNEGKTLVWKRHVNVLLIFDKIAEYKIYTPMMLAFAERFDPKQAIVYLYKMQQDGRATIEIKNGTKNDEPIRILGRYLRGKYLTHYRPNMPHWYDVLVVDPQTKLVTQIELYEVKDGGDELQGVYKDYDYQPFDPNIFDIEKEVPSDAVRIVEYDCTDVNSVGIERGNLDANQIGPVVVQEFFNALIARDYEKVGQLFGGMPTNEAEMQFGNINIVRVVSIGNKVEKNERSPAYYPCVVEIEENGKISEWRPRVIVREVLNSHSQRYRVGAVK